MLVLVPATEDHVDALLPRLRATDREEWATYIDGDVGAALKHALFDAAEAWAVVEDGEVIALLATTVPHPGDYACPWLVSAEGAIDRRWRYLVRYTRPWVRHLLARWPTLYVVCSSAEPRKLAWLRRAGFTPIRTVVPSPGDGTPYYELIAI